MTHKEYIGPGYVVDVGSLVWSADSSGLLMVVVVVVVVVVVGVVGSSAAPVLSVSLTGLLMPCSELRNSVS